VKRIRITIDVDFDEGDKDNFSEGERDNAIKDMQDTIKQEFIYNNVREIYSSVISSKVKSK